MAPTVAFETIFADAVPNVAAMAARLEEEILKCDPNSVHVAYPGYNSVSYGIGPKKNSQAYAYLMKHDDRVNLGLYRGRFLADPDNLLEGTGKELRHVKVRETDLAESPAVAALIQACVDERRAALGGK